MEYVDCAEKFVAYIRILTVRLSQKSYKLCNRIFVLAFLENF